MRQLAVGLLGLATGAGLAVGLAPPAGADPSSVADPVTYPAPDPPGPAAVVPDGPAAPEGGAGALAVTRPVTGAAVPLAQPSPELEAVTAPLRASPPAVAGPPPQTAAAPHRPRFVASIPRPDQIAWNIGHVGTNASIALALVLMLGLPAELLNSSLKARAAGRPTRVRSALLTRLEARLNRYPDPLLLVGFSVAGAVVYSQLEPEMRFDGTSMLFLVALTMALIVVTGVLELVRVPYLYRRHHVRSHLTMFPRAFLVAVVLVLASRITGFQPGFIFGITCGLAVTGRLRDEDEGRSIAVACAALLLVAALGWVAWIPVSSAASAADAGSIAMLLDSFLATLWVTGLQVVLFGLLPFRFLYGEKVLRWSRTGWLALYGTATFLFVQTLFHPQASQWAGLSEHAVRVLGASGVLLFLVAVGFWLWVGRALAPTSPDEPAEVLSATG
ncbi:MAG: FGLLP motif-containing membrane protein [Acidimicrobiia bacterium]